MISTLSINDWQVLSPGSLAALSAPRMYLHHAAQFLAATGKALVSPKADDSHTSLLWHAGLQALCSEPVDGIRAALRPSDLSLVIVDSEHHVLEQKALPGLSRPQGLNWLKSALTKHVKAGTSELSLKLHYEIDPFPGSADSPFSPQPESALQQLGAYFHNANAVLQSIHNQVAESSDVRCWPHHFDIATLITLDAGKSAEEARSIGVGLSPGDAGNAEPYFYITPWPYPDIKSVSLPNLPAGHWNTEGWVGAVLAAGEFVKTTNAREQSDIVSGFLQTAVNACYSLLEQK